MLGMIIREIFLCQIPFHPELIWLEETTRIFAKKLIAKLEISQAITNQSISNIEAKAKIHC